MKSEPFFKTPRHLMHPSLASVSFVLNDHCTQVLKSVLPLPTPLSSLVHRLEHKELALWVLQSLQAAVVENQESAPAHHHCIHPGSCYLNPHYWKFQVHIQCWMVCCLHSHHIHSCLLNPQEGDVMPGPQLRQRSMVWFPSRHWLHAEDWLLALAYVYWLRLELQLLSDVSCPWMKVTLFRFTAMRILHVLNFYDR